MVFISIVILRFLQTGTMFCTKVITVYSTLPHFSSRGICLASHSRHCLLNIKSGVRRPRRLDFSLAQRAVHLLDSNQFLDLEDHTGELGMHRVEDGLHSTAQA
jgi:hypothetical protein